MAKIPPLKRMSQEDFKDQASWIGTLLGPINEYFERSTSALNRSLTINDNFAGEIRVVDIDGQFPLKLSWSISARPLAVTVGNAYRVDGVSLNLASALQVQWQFNQAGQLQIDNVLGLLPPVGRFSDADVDAGADTISIAGHGYATKDKIVATSASTLPAGLTSGNTYYVIRNDTNTIQLATSTAGAVAGTAVDITAAAGGDQHLLTPGFQYKYKVVLVCLTG